jgi:hypothetical protein
VGKTLISAPLSDSTSGSIIQLSPAEPRRTDVSGRPLAEAHLTSDVSASSYWPNR